MPTVARCMDPVALAHATLAAVDEGRYPGLRREAEFAAAVRAAIEGTRVITPDRAVSLSADVPRDLGAVAAIEVVDESAVAVCRRLARESRVTVLNFASANSVGGGFLSGAAAQEEDLCRCSALFRCLERGVDYYRANRACGSALYTDHAIWSPDVPFCRAEDHGWLPEPFVASVITSPAPNTRRFVGDSGELTATFRRRARQALAIAAAEPPMSLVLGAWGCGAFGGDAEVVATAFREALDDGFVRAFERIVFAVLVRRWPDGQNLDVFRRVFAGSGH
jgi:uncharacterized protein (TIGR02452 family)